MSRSARIFIVLVGVCAASVLGLGLIRSAVDSRDRFLWLLVVAVISSRLKVKLPGTDTNMSVNLPFLLLASAEMDLLSTVLIASAATIAQSVRAEGPTVNPVQMLFNTSTMVVAAAAAHWPQQLSGSVGPTATTKLLLVGALLFFLVNTAFVAMIVSLTVHAKVLSTWREIVGLTYPYYVLSAAMAAVILTVNNILDWRVVLVALLALYGVHRSFQLYFQMAADHQPEPV